MALGNLLQGYLSAQRGNEAATVQQYGILQKLLAQKQAEQQAAAATEYRNKSLGLQERGLDVRQAESVAAREARTAEAEANRASREGMAADAAASREAMAAEALAQRTADAAAARAQRMDELKLRLADQKLANADRAALQRELVMMRAEQSRLDAEQKRANSPQAIKEREKVAGKSSLTSLLDELEGDYVAYQKLGADIDPNRNSAVNVMNRIGSSSVGQLVGGAVGTKEQEVRDSINQKRASLMAALKQATGMGATQLNSNVELQFYLKMATDPTMARSANQKAIKWLRDTYGIQGGATGVPTSSPTPAPQGGGGWSIRPLP